MECRDDLSHRQNLVTKNEAKILDCKTVASLAICHRNCSATLFISWAICPHARNGGHFPTARNRSHGAFHDFAPLRSVHHLCVVEVSSTDGTRQTFHAIGHSLAQSNRKSLAYGTSDAGSTFSDYRTAGR
jgi:hypothetical protein